MMSIPIPEPNSVPHNRKRIETMMTGFQSSCVLGAASELGLFDILDAGPLTGEKIADAAKVDLRGVKVLLDALAALEILIKEGECYEISYGMAPLLRDDSPDSMGPMIRHWMTCLRAWGRLADSVQTGKPAHETPSIRGADADRESFIGGMHSLNALSAEPLIERLAQSGEFDDVTYVLDVGGASGTWTIALLEAIPDALATVFDLPDAIEQAKQRIRALEPELRDRVCFASGDFYKDELPHGADLAWVSAIIHQHGRKENVALFKKVRDALQPGGRIAIRDVVMESDRLQPTPGVLFALNMLVHTETGGTFTFEEISEDLKAAGFKEPELTLESPFMDAVVMATRA
jgi:SAM-dependent methyltransferase